MTTEKKGIPFCPLMSAGSDVDMVCTQDRCGWYMAQARKCAIYILGFNALIQANNNQQLPKKRL